MLTKYDISTRNDIRKQHTKIGKNDYNTIHSNVVNRFSNVKLLNDNSIKNKDIHKKIYSFDIFIPCDSKTVRLNVESIFKSLKCNKLMPLMKLNSGIKKEYVFRMYSNEKTKENEKIPYLDRNQIKHYVSQKKPRRNKYVMFDIHIKNTLYTNMSLYENGDIELAYETKIPQLTSVVEDTYLSKVNEILKKINSTSGVPSHYEFQKIHTLENSDYVVKNIDFTFDYTFDGNIKRLNKNLNSSAKNIRDIFSVITNNSMNIMLDMTRRGIYDNVNPRLTMTINNKLITTRVTLARSVLYLQTAPILVIGLLNYLQKDSTFKTVQKKKNEYVYQDIDEDAIQKNQYLTKYEDGDDEEENEVIVEKQNKDDDELSLIHI